jgi:hypothetical protein
MLSKIISGLLSQLWWELNHCQCYFGSSIQQSCSHANLFKSLRKKNSPFPSLHHILALLGFWNILLSTLFNLNLNRTFHHFPREKQQWTRWEWEKLEEGNAPYHLANLFLFINLLHGTVSLMALTLKWKRSPWSILSKSAIMTLGRSRTRIAFNVLSYFSRPALTLRFRFIILPQPK